MAAREAQEKACIVYCHCCSFLQLSTSQIFQCSNFNTLHSFLYVSQYQTKEPHDTSGCLGASSLRTSSPDAPASPTAADNDEGMDLLGRRRLFCGRPLHATVAPTDRGGRRSVLVPAQERGTGSRAACRRPILGHGARRSSTDGP